tara:strand:- start:42 stop:1631 length:1590 start_codon:yes stop_codon:yes gene_type:complete
MKIGRDLSLDEKFTKAINYHKNKKIDLAEKLYKEVIKKDPNHIRALNNLGIIFFSLKKFNKAIEVFEKAITIDVNYLSAHNNLGLLYKEIQNYQKATSSFGKALKINPNYFEAHNNIGLLFYECEEYAKAISSYEKAILINPNYFETYNSIGLAFSKCGKYEDAINKYEKAIKINPNYFKAYNNLGIAFYECGEYEKAINSFKKAIKINPNIMESHCNIGLVYEKTGDINKAFDSYKNVPSTDSNYIYAQYNLASLLYKDRQFKKAVKIFKLIDYKNSKSYLLKSLYELNDQSNFITELDNEIKKGTADAIIGSLINSAKIRYRIKKKNLFCEDPLNYVFTKNLNEFYDFKNIFIKTSKDILNDYVFKERLQPLLINSIQSAGNIFYNKNKLVKKMENIIHKEIENYRVKYNKSDDGIIKNWPKNYDLKGWLVKMKSGGKIKPHIHDYGWLSGSIYINIPPKLNINSGNLVVCLDENQNETIDKNIDNNKIINVVTGSLCLFPASLFHYTIPFKSDEERIVLAFDVMAK